MAIEIKEYIGANFMFAEGSVNKAPMGLAESKHYSNKVAKGSIMALIEGLHSVVTRNNTFYTDKAMIKSEKFWTNPYEIPVIMHHDEEKGVTVGRVKQAYWTDKNTRSNTGALRFITNIAHKDGIEGIKNGTLSTVSVGVLADEVRCSICNHDIASYGECEHERGSYYEGELCYWKIESFEPKELSFVIVPSDQYAHIIDVYEPDKKEFKENKEVNKMDTWAELINESEKISLSESKKEEDNETTTEKEEVENKENDNNNMHTNENEKEEQEEKKEEEKKEEEKIEEQEEKTEEQKEEKTEEDSKDNAEESNENTEEEKQSDKKEINEEVKKDIVIEDTDIYKNMKVALDAVKSENENLKQQIKDLETKLSVEVKLKESAENQLIEIKTEQKRSLVKQVNKLRESINLQKEDEETLMKNNEDALQMTIKNLKEFSSQIGALSIPKVKSDIAISESKDNTQKNITSKTVKEANQSSNINLEESLIENIFSAAFSGSRV